MASSPGPCDLIGPHEISRIQRVETLSTYSFADGSAIGDGRIVPPGTEICVLIAVPQNPPNGVLLDVPIESKGPDNLHIFIKSDDVQLSFRPPRPIPDQLSLRKPFANNTSILYYAETTLYHDGAYQLFVDHEWSNWWWAKQWRDDFEQNVTRYPTGAKIPFPSREERVRQYHEPEYYDWVSVSQDDHHPPVIDVANGGDWEANRRRRVCDIDYEVDRGRWYSRSRFPGLIQEFDEWGYAYDGDTCQFDFFTDYDVMNCLAGLQIHAYGDSQLRRITKTITSGGHFCRNTSHECQRMDGAMRNLVFDNDGGLVKSLEEEKYKPFNNSEFTNLPTFGSDSRIHWAFLRDLVYDYRDWTRLFYDKEDHSTENALALDESPEPSIFSNHAFDPTQDIRLGAKARQSPSAPPADLVLLGFGSWDAAFATTFEELERVLPSFRDALLDAYPPSVPIVLRLLNGYCCRHKFDDFRRYTGTRIQHMNDLIREAFDVHGVWAADGRIIVVDPEVLTGRPDVVSDYPESEANHPRFSHVRTETQLLYNKICERDAQGKAVLRNWTWGT
ncbi:MAG: hypothetical protein M1828_003767 [Chrysothrix sp. TS-e1954]|nr:MAG: hypothetical protein M1828_003767 [Chrysothrix sp. TS-e1954]